MEIWTQGSDSTWIKTPFAALPDEGSELPLIELIWYEMQRRPDDEKYWFVFSAEEEKALDKIGSRFFRVNPTLNLLEGVAGRLRDLSARAPYLTMIPENTRKFEPPFRLSFAHYHAPLC